ncbi:MAG: RNA pseudouridine synthase, partial [Deltaproteobacteria bacterium]|nr:RNA pseudouridine synthase [Deltaproteobacteria bacterium]
MIYQPPVQTELNILYSDQDILAVDKPAGLLSVPGRGPDRQDCLLSRVQQLFADALVVHRLDMSTSGVMILARNAAAQRQLSRQFELRQVKKSYLAIVSGRVVPHAGEIDLPLICDWPN